MIEVGQSPGGFLRNIAFDVQRWEFIKENKKVRKQEKKKKEIDQESDQEKKNSTKKATK